MHDLKINSYKPILSVHSSTYPYYVATVGETFRERAYRPKGIEDYQLLYTKSGEGIGLVDGNEICFKKNMIFFLPPHTPHEYYAANGEWETKWITFNGSGVEELLRECDNACEWKNDENIFFSIHKKIIIAQETLDLKEASILLYKLLLEFKACSDRKVMYSGRVKDKLLPVMEYIRDHYCEEISVTELAACAGITESHFCRIFKSLTGLRPVEYVTQLRVARAKLLLANTGMSVREVAENVGYTGISYFIKQFKLIEGVTPAKFREAKKIF